MKKKLNITKSLSFASLGILLVISLFTNLIKVNPIRALSMPITPPITSPITPPNTPTPSPRPTSTPTLTPRPTNRPTNTPTPSPKPKPNNLPVIQTNSLPNAKRGSNYWARVNAYDLDFKNILQMKISNLPAGLKQAKCTAYYKASTVWLGCDIEGKTYAPKATYKVQVTVKDNKGGTAAKTLLLKVN